MAPITQTICESGGARGMQAYEWVRYFKGPYEYAPRDGWYRQTTECGFNTLGAIDSNHYDKPSGKSGIECIGTWNFCEPTAEEIRKNDPTSKTYVPPGSENVGSGGVAVEDMGDIDNFYETEGQIQTCFYKKKGDIVNRNARDRYRCMSPKDKQDDDIDGDMAIERISNKLAEMIGDATGVDPSYLLGLRGLMDNYRTVTRRGADTNFDNNRELLEAIEDEFKIVFETYVDTVSFECTQPVTYQPERCEGINGEDVEGCPKLYEQVLGTCWDNCPEGYSDDGEICNPLDGIKSPIQKKTSPAIRSTQVRRLSDIDSRTSIIDETALDLVTYGEELESRPKINVETAVDRDGLPTIRALARAIAAGKYFLGPDYATQCMVQGGDIQMDAVIEDEIKPPREPTTEWEKYPVGSPAYNAAIAAARLEWNQCGMEAYTDRWWDCMYQKEAREREAAKIKRKAEYEDAKLKREREMIKTQKWRYTRGMSVWNTTSGVLNTLYNYKISDPIDTDKLSIDSEFREKGSTTNQSKRSKFVEKCLMRCAGYGVSGFGILNDTSGDGCSGVYFTGDGEGETCVGLGGSLVGGGVSGSDKKYFEKTDLPSAYSVVTPWTQVNSELSYDSNCGDNIINGNYDCKSDITPKVHLSINDGVDRRYRAVSKELSPDNKCGPNNNNTRCPDDKCCNENGDCGGGEPTQDNMYCKYNDNTGSIGSRMGYHGAHQGDYDGIGDEPAAPDVEMCLEAGRCEKVWGVDTDPEYEYCKDLTYPTHPLYPGKSGDNVCPQPYDNNKSDLIDSEVLYQRTNGRVILNTNSGWNRREYEFTVDDWDYFNDPPGLPWHKICRDQMKSTDVGYSVHRKTWGDPKTWRCKVYEDNDNKHAWNQQCVDTPFENENACLSYPDGQPQNESQPFAGSGFFWRRKVPGRARPPSNPLVGIISPTMDPTAQKCWVDREKTGILSGDGCTELERSQLGYSIEKFKEKCVLWKCDNPPADNTAPAYEDISYPTGETWNTLGSCWQEYSAFHRSLYPNDPKCVFRKQQKKSTCDDNKCNTADIPVGYGPKPPDNPNEKMSCYKSSRGAVKPNVGTYAHLCTLMEDQSAESCAGTADDNDYYQPCCLENGSTSKWIPKQYDYNGWMGRCTPGTGYGYYDEIPYTPFFAKGGAHGQPRWSTVSKSDETPAPPATDKWGNEYAW